MNNLEQTSRGQKGSAREINLKEIFGIIKKRFWVVALTAILATLAGYFYSVSFNPVPLYQSSTRVLIGGDSVGMSTLRVMIKDPTVLGEVSEKLNHQRSPGGLSGEITAEIIDSSSIISISVIDRDPAFAAKIANTTASVFKAKAAAILNFTEIQLLSKAEVNLGPINPDNRNEMFIALFMGLVVGIGLVFLLNSLDETVQSERELEELLDVPVLGNIPKMNNKNMYRRPKHRYLGKNVIELFNVREIVARKGKSDEKSDTSGHKDQEISKSSTGT